MMRFMEMPRIERERSVFTQGVRAVSEDSIHPTKMNGLSHPPVLSSGSESGWRRDSHGVGMQRAYYSIVPIIPDAQGAARIRLARPWVHDSSETGIDPDGLRAAPAEE
jgi:hypothetical protein